MKLPGSGTIAAGWAAINALSVPATRTGPDEGDRVKAMVAPPTNVLPSDSIKVAGLNVATNPAEVKLTVSGNCRTESGLPSESSNWPGWMSPKKMS
jgi:hypothetical protein